MALQYRRPWPSIISGVGKVRLSKVKSCRLNKRDLKTRISSDCELRCPFCFQLSLCCQFVLLCVTSRFETEPLWRVSINNDFPNREMTVLCAQTWGGGTSVEVPFTFYVCSVPLAVGLESTLLDCLPLLYFLLSSNDLSRTFFSV